MLNKNWFFFLVLFLIVVVFAAVFIWFATFRSSLINQAELQGNVTPAAYEQTVSRNL